MRILLIADHEDDTIWTHWDTAGKDRLKGVSLILSAGDIKASYLEFLVTMLGVPCLYIRGNHDQFYHEQPPRGCVCIEDGVIEVVEQEDTGRVMLREEAIRSGAMGVMRESGNTGVSNWFRALRYAVGKAAEIDPCGVRTYRIAGLGGSMRYHEGPDMYTEREMAARVHRLSRNIRRGVVRRVNGRQAVSRDLRDKTRRLSGRAAGSAEADPVVDILLTHAPCRGYGDLEDLPHRGFDCFNSLFNELRPRYHCYGHVHMEYGMIDREAEHPSGTHLINVSGMYLLDLQRLG